MYRSRLNSTGDDDESDDDADVDDEQPDSEYSLDGSDTMWRNEFEDHFISMSARERLQEFQGRIPPKKKQSNKSDKKRPETKAEHKSKVKVSNIYMYFYYLYSLYRVCDTLKSNI